MLGLQCGTVWMRSVSQLNFGRVERGEYWYGVEQRRGRCGNRLKRVTAVDVRSHQTSRGAACHVFVGSVAHTANCR